jgi:hypothetical protein
MAIHLMDPAFWALELGGPVKVSSKGPAPNPHSAPKWMETKFELGARGKLPPVNVSWCEGAAHPTQRLLNAHDANRRGVLFGVARWPTRLTGRDTAQTVATNRELGNYLPPSPKGDQSQRQHYQPPG